MRFPGLPWNPVRVNSGTMRELLKSIFFQMFVDGFHWFSFFTIVFQWLVCLGTVSLLHWWESRATCNSDLLVCNVIFIESVCFSFTRWKGCFACCVGEVAVAQCAVQLSGKLLLFQARIVLVRSPWHGANCNDSNVFLKFGKFASRSVSVESPWHGARCNRQVIHYE